MHCNAIDSFISNRNIRWQVRTAVRLILRRARWELGCRATTYRILGVLVSWCSVTRCALCACIFTSHLANALSCLASQFLCRVQVGSKNIALVNNILTYDGCLQVRCCLACIFACNRMAGILMQTRDDHGAIAFMKADIGSSGIVNGNVIKTCPGS